MKILLLLLLLFIPRQIVLADQEGDGFVYTAETADKKHIFVMLNSSEPGNPPYEHDIYTQSGMYLNNGSSVPLWTVDWSAFIYLPNGGDYVVRRGQWARTSGTYEEEAFSFIDRGKLLKSYRAIDLIDFPWLLPHSVSHYKWSNACSLPSSDNEVSMNVGGSHYQINSGVKFDDESKTIEVETAFSDRLTFDLKTGEMISAHHPSRRIFLTLLTGLLLVYFLFRFKTFRSFPGKSLLEFSNLMIGMIACLSVVLLPSIVVHLYWAHGSCNDEIPTLLFKVWQSAYFFPAYSANFMYAEIFKPEIFLNVSSTTFFVCTAAFWSFCLLIFGILDRSVVWAMHKFNAVPQ